MRARSIGLIFALSATAAGCSLVANFDGLVGDDTSDSAPGEGDASLSDGNFTLTDGAQPGVDANGGPIDATSDAPIVDSGSTPTDDGAPPQLQGNGGPFCMTDASTILFCDDFFGNKINTNVWDTNKQGTGGALTVQSRSYWSSPRAFLGYLPAQSSGDNYQAINANIPFGTGRFKVEFKFYLDLDFSGTQGGSGTNYGDFAQLYLDNDSAYAAFYFSKTTFSMEVDTFSGTTENDMDISFLMPPPTGAWHAMEIDTVFSSTGTGSIVVTMDGTQLTSKSNLVNLLPDAGAPTFEPGFGIENIGVVGETYLYIDDVRVSSF